MRRPPGSTLFPYTTLSRSRDQRVELGVVGPLGALAAPLGDRLGEVARARSEEHTSELQSQSNIVCRPPLEKTNRAPPPATMLASLPPRSSSLAMRSFGLSV